MASSESKRAGFPGAQPRICGGIERRVNHDDPTRLDRITQLKRSRQISAAQHFVTHRVGNRDPTEKLPQQIKFASYRKTDQWTGVSYYEPVRHLSIDSTSSRTVAVVPATTGIPSFDT